MTQEQLQDLAQLRGELDRIDDQILDLIEERLAASADIAARKDADGDRHLKVRPKRQVHILDRALDILHYEVKDQHLDPELVRIFREARVWERCTKS